MFKTKKGIDYRAELQHLGRAPDKNRLYMVLKGNNPDEMAKVAEREKILSKIMKDLNKADNRKLKSIAKIVNISVS